MLSLQLKSGEYLTIGDDIVVQVFEQGGAIRVAVKAPPGTVHPPWRGPRAGRPAARRSAPSAAQDPLRAGAERPPHGGAGAEKGNRRRMT